MKTLQEKLKYIKDNSNQFLVEEFMNSSLSFEEFLERNNIDTP